MPELIFTIDNTALETVKNVKLNANFAEMATALKEMIEPYASMVVTDDTIPQAKADKAKINKVIKAIDERRKLVKTVYTTPLKEFEDNCKQLTAICTQGTSNLDTQIKAYEEEVKRQKIESMREYFDGLPKQHPDFADFNRVYNERWKNVTYPVETIHAEIDAYVAKVETEVTTIKAFNSKFEAMMLDEYTKTGNITAALAIKQRAEASEAEAERRRQEAEARRQEQLRKQQEYELQQQQRQQEELTKSQMRRMEEQQIPVQPIPPTPEEVHLEFYPKKKFTVVCTSATEEEALKQLCSARGMVLIEGGAC